MEEKVIETKEVVTKSPSKEMTFTVPREKKPNIFDKSAFRLGAGDTEFQFYGVYYDQKKEQPKPSAGIRSIF